MAVCLLSEGRKPYLLEPPIPWHPKPVLALLDKDLSWYFARCVQASAVPHDASAIDCENQIPEASSSTWASANHLLTAMQVL